MPSVSEFAAINRAAEMIATMGIRPAGAPAYAYATQLLGLVKSIQEECRAKWPQLVGNIMAGNIITLQRLDVQSEVVNAAKQHVGEFDECNVKASTHDRLIAAVHVHNLVTEMPIAADVDPPSDQPTITQENDQ